MSYATTLQRVGAETDPEHSAVMFLTQLAGGGDGRRGEMAAFVHAREAAAAHGARPVEMANSKPGLKRSWSERSAQTDLVRQIQRKARRKSQSDLVRQLDAVLPDSFRRGVSFNGAGGRALGIAGRSLHDVLEDAVMAVAWVRSAQPGSAPAQQTGGDAGASTKRGDSDVERPKASPDASPCSGRHGAHGRRDAAHGRPSPTYGALMREFMESSGTNLCDVSADSNLFVLFTGLRDRGVRRKAPHKLLPDKRDSASSAQAAPSRQISSSTQRLCFPASPAEDSSTTHGADSWSAHATPSPPPEKMARERLSLAPLVLNARQHPRLPPMRMVSGSAGGLMAAQAAQMSGVLLSGAACKTTEQGQEPLMQELSRVAATACLREQVLLLHLLQQSTARWPSLGKVDNDTQALAPPANLPQFHVPSDLLLRLPVQ